MKKIIFYVFLILLFSFSASAEAQDINLNPQTVTYSHELQADLYRFTNKKNIPAVILVHGGYWSKGSRRELAGFAKKFADKGFLAMTIDYRLLPNYKQEEQTSDVIEALWWLRQNGKALGVDSSKVGIVGLSAGGYLAAWASTHDMVNSNGVHSLPNAVVTFYAPWDLTKKAVEEVSENEPLVAEFCAGRDRELISPFFAVSSNIPPILFIHGDVDTLVPVSQSIKAYNKVKSVHGKGKLIIIHNDGHCFTCGNNYEKAMDYSVRFLEKTLK